jgi:hypothetical protein
MIGFLANFARRARDFSEVPVMRRMEDQREEEQAL